MIVGCTKEIKNNEFRVGLTLDNVLEYVNHGHDVLMEAGAGVAVGFTDDQYKKAGAEIISSADEVWSKSDMIVKVKEPIEAEYDRIKEGQILYTYLHLAADEPLTKVLLEKKVKSVAYETITNPDGKGLPCLWPMSQIAGRLSIQQGAKFLEKKYGGSGMLLSGVPGVKKGNVVIIGGGMAGTYAAKAGVGIGANVTVLDINLDRLAYLEDIFGNSITTLYSSEGNRAQALSQADVVIGSVLIPGSSTPKLVREDHLDIMKDGAVIVDIAIDQGGCCESSHVTTHDDPIFIKKGVVHYCVGNMPGAVPYTSTMALTNATLRNGLLIADNGVEKAAQINKGIFNGVNTYDGNCTYKGVADALNLEFVDYSNWL